jgi:hypothetical protein
VIGPVVRLHRSQDPEGIRHTRAGYWILSNKVRESSMSVSSHDYVSANAQSHAALRTLQLAGSSHSEMLLRGSLSEKPPFDFPGRPPSGQNKIIMCFSHKSNIPMRL